MRKRAVSADVIRIEGGIAVDVLKIDIRIQCGTHGRGGIAQGGKPLRTAKRSHNMQPVGVSLPHAAVPQAAVPHHRGGQIRPRRTKLFQNGGGLLKAGEGPCFPNRDPGHIFGHIDGPDQLQIQRAFFPYRRTLPVEQGGAVGFGHADIPCILAGQEPVADGKRTLIPFLLIDVLDVVSAADGLHRLFPDPEFGVHGIVAGRRARGPGTHVGKRIPFLNHREKRGCPIFQAEHRQIDPVRVIGILLHI